ALLARSENMGIAITQIIALAGAMISGLWVPLEEMPDFMQTVAGVFPQYWAHQAMLDALWGQLTFSGFIQAAAVLCAIGCGAILIAWLAYPAYLRQARH